MKKIILITLTILLITVCLTVCPVYAYDINWQKTHGPYGGWLEPMLMQNFYAKRIIATFDATSFSGNDFVLNKLILYSGTNGRGVAKSTDGGEHWIMMDPSLGGIAEKQVTILGFSPTDSATLFAGTYNGGLWMSTDSGSSWSQIDGTQGKRILDISVSVDNPSIIYTVLAQVTKFTGLPYKIDLSVPTCEVLPLPGNMTIQSIRYDSYHDKLYATTKGGYPTWYLRIYSTTDDGATWINEKAMSGQVSMRILEIFTPPPTSEVYVGRGPSAVYVSIDNAGAGGWIDSPGYDGHGEFLALNLDDQNFAFTIYNNVVYRTTNHGSNWQIKNSGLPPVTDYGPLFSIRYILPNPKGGPPAIFLHSSNGIYASSDGGENFVEINGQQISTQQSDQSFVNTSIDCLAVDDDEGIIYAGGKRITTLDEDNGHGMHRSTDQGETWARINNGLVGVGIKDVIVQKRYSSWDYNPDIVYLANQTGIYKSLDKGNVWESNGDIITRCFAIDKYNSPWNIYAGTSANGVYIGLSNQYGVYEWQPLTGNNLLDVNISALEVGLDGTIYAGTEQGGIFKLVSGAPSWEISDPVGTGIPGPVNAIAIDPATSEYVYVGADWYIYRSTDAGDNWVNKKGFGINNDVTDIFIDSDTLPSTIYVVTEGNGIWRGTNEGDSWEQINVSDTGVDFSNTLYSIARDETTKTFYLGNANLGVSKGIPDVGPPPKPINFLGSAESFSKIVWSWDDVSDEFGYRFYRDTPSGETKTLYSGTTSFGETGLSPNRLYTRHVAAYTTTETESDPDTECTYAKVPVDLRYRILGLTSIEVLWSSNGNPPYAENPTNTKYIVEMATAESGPYSEISSTEGVLITAVTSLEPHTVYYFRIYAVNQYGIPTDYSEALRVVTIHETKGPLIEEIRFDGRIFVDGDYISPDPLITAHITDESEAPEPPNPIHKEDIIIKFGDFYEILGNDIDFYGYDVELGKYMMRHQIKDSLGHGDYVFTITASDEIGNVTVAPYPDKIVRIRAGAVQLVAPTTVYPTPFSPLTKGGEAIISYELNVDAPISIYMYDIAGEVVWTRKFGSRTEGGRAGYNEVKWNGITDFGGYAGNGIYVYRIVSQGKLIGTGKLVVYD